MNNCGRSVDDMPKPLHSNTKSSTECGKHITGHLDTKSTSIDNQPMEEIVVPLSVVLHMVGTLCDDCKETVRKYLSARQFNIRKPIDRQIIGIMEAVSEETQVSIATMRQKNNSPSVVHARRRVAVMARRYGISYPKIGAALCKHHTTILHLVKTAEKI